MKDQRSAVPQAIATCKRKRRNQTSRRRLAWSFLSAAALALTLGASEVRAEERIVYSINVGLRHDFYSVRTDGTDVRKLTSWVSEDEYFGTGVWPAPGEPRWSPDGTELLFSGTTPSEDPDPSCTSACYDGNVYVMNANCGLNVRNLTESFSHASFPRWSPDGNYIAFASPDTDNGHMAIWIMEADGNNPRQVSEYIPDWPIQPYPLWSKNGETIFFNATRLDTFTPGEPGGQHLDHRIYAIKLSAQTQTLVYEKLASENDPDALDGYFWNPFRWSPDGQTLAWSDLREGPDDPQGSYDVFVAPGGFANLDSATNLTSDGQNEVGVLWNNHAFLAWSHDGSQILFSTDRDEPDALYGTRYLYTMDADGQNPQAIRSDEEQDPGRGFFSRGSADWSPPIPENADNDCWVDFQDNCTEVVNDDQGDLDSNTIGDACNSFEDLDEDDWADDLDNCPETVNADQADLDQDNIGDPCDDDRDGDDFLNDNDVFPDNAAEWLDTDFDGLGNNEDLDDDNDGLDDVFESDTGVFIDADDTGSDPLLFDSDCDNWDDFTEVELGTDPNDGNSRPDSEGEKLILTSRQSGDWFGWATALSGDGQMAIVGSFYVDTETVNNAGAADIFVRSPEGCWHHEERLFAPSPFENDRFGRSVTLSGTGDTAAVGSKLSNSEIGGNDAGSVDVFLREDGTWLHQARLEGPDPNPGDQFGESAQLDASGNRLLIGAGFTDTEAIGDIEAQLNTGAAHFYTRADGVWTHRQELLAADAEEGDLFGVSVALAASGDTAMVTAYHDDTAAGGTHAGSVHVFAWNEAEQSFALEQKLESPTPTANSIFGSALALSAAGDVAAVGEAFKGIFRGAAYVFTRTAGTWDSGTTLSDPDYYSSALFGSSVAISPEGDFVAVGKPDVDTNAQTSGRADVFGWDEQQWSHLYSRTPADGDKGDLFGTAVAFSSGSGELIVGAPKHNPVAGADAGSAYVFAPEPGAGWLGVVSLMALAALRRKHPAT